MTHLATFAMREDAGRAVPPIPELAMLVPTRNEAANIEELLRRVSAAVTGIATEIVFVDDSDDDTPAVIRTVARRRGGGPCQVSLIHRQGGQRTGGLGRLGGAVVDGLRAVDAHELRPRGFKILLELLVRNRGLRTTEVAYAFADRSAGESKGSLREGLTYARSLAVLRLGRGTPSPSRPAAAAAVELLAPLARHAGAAGA